MRAAGSALALLAAIAACAPVSTGSVSTLASNTCVATPDCAAYQQTGGALKCGDTGVCQARGGLDVTFVVTLPDGGSYAPGYTFIAKYADLPTARGCATNTVCRVLPTLGQFAGLYATTNQIASDVRFYIGGGSLIRSLPTIPTFRPAWTFVTGAQPVDAALLGLPVQPLVAPPVLNDEPSFPAAGDLPSGRTPPSVGFDVLVPAGYYEETLAPVGPLAAAFPPAVVGAVPKPAPLRKRDASDFQNFTVGVDISSPRVIGHPVTVTRGGGLSLAGWTLVLRDSRTRRPISSAPHLSAASVVTLFTVNQAAPSDSGKGDTIRDGVELVLAPPAGESPRPPELVLLALFNRVPGAAPYPLLPFQAVVDGAVLAGDGSGAQANVVVLSKELAMLDSELSATDLRFVDQFTTAADGTFSRTLPPGKYHAVLTPPADTGFAKTVLDIEIATPTGEGQHQALKPMRLARQELLRGSVRATDGRGIEGADVEAHPAALLPTDASQDVREPLRWPRTVHTRTNGAGEFVLPVDPGGIFDVVVRPPEGSAFPWVVKQGITTPSRDLLVDVPAPIVVAATLLSPGAQTVGHALLQAFIGVPSTTPGAACTVDNDATQAISTMCPAATPRCVAGHCVAVVALEVGRARTDDAGRFTLFLDGRPR